MKLLIEIPEDAKIAFDNAESNDLKGCYYDHGGIIGNAIKNGKPLDESFEWCTDCKEYDHSRHCCPRWTKVIRTTLNESINAVLDEIKAEFKSKADGDDWYHATDGLVWEEAMEIIDKHMKGENE